MTGRVLTYYKIYLLNHTYHTNGEKDNKQQDEVKNSRWRQHGIVDNIILKKIVLIVRKLSKLPMRNVNVTMNKEFRLNLTFINIVKITRSNKRDRHRSQTSIEIDYWQ